VTVTVKDSSSSTTESNFGSYHIDLSLSNSGVFSGTTSGQTTSGVLTLSSLYILSSNSFTITASSTNTGVSSITSSSFTVTNSAKSIALTASTTTPSMNFLFSVTAAVTGDDNTPFLGGCSFTLTGTSLAGAPASATTTSTSTGQLTLSSLYMTATGSKTLTGTCAAASPATAKTQTLQLTVQSLKVRITSFTPVVTFMQPTTSISAFAVTFGVYDAAGTNLETNIAVYSAALTLSSGTLSGTATGNTAGGQISFTSLYVLTAGAFTLSATATGATTDISAQFSVSNYVKTITVTALPSSPTANFLFTVTVTLNGDDGNPYMSAVTVTLTETTSNAVINPANTAIGNSGTATFSIYLAALGAKSLQASVPATGGYSVVTGSTSITVLTMILKISASSTASV
jgi:hypothetical protein